MPPTKFYFLVFICVIVYLLFPFHRGRTNIAVAAGMPGIGISLTVSYAVISLRKEDGSFEDVGRVEGDQSYVDMMQRLSVPEAKHPSPPYDNMEELWKDWPRQLARSARKGVGLPASADVGKLSGMLKQLLDLPTASPGLSLRDNPVVISYPGIYGLYQEDIVDAAAYLGVQTLYGLHHYQPRNLVAAYAGHGLGLCENYQDKEACRQEGLNMPVHETLLVEYTEHALLQQANIMREAHDLASRDIDLSANFDLGSHHTPDHEGAAKIGEAVLQFLQKKYDNLGPPKKIVAIMIGSDVRQEVVEAVTDAVRTLGSESEVLKSGPEYVAARGAAELAWRSIERRESTEL